MSKYGYGEMGVIRRIIYAVVCLALALFVRHALGEELNFERVWSSIWTVGLLMFWPGADRIYRTYN